MEKEIYIGIPLVISIFIEYFIPYFTSLHCHEVWFAPSKWICVLLFLAINILIGFTLYEYHDDTLIFVLAWLLFFFNILWAYFLKRHDTRTIITLFLSLLFGYFIYNSIFLYENESKNIRLTFLDLYSFYIVWIGFTITLVFEYSKNKRINLE